MGTWPVDEVGLAGETAPGEGSISSGNAAAILAIVESKYDGRLVEGCDELQGLFLFANGCNQDNS